MVLLGILMGFVASARAENRLGVGFPYSVEVTAPDGAVVRLHAEEAGQGTPVVLIHGLGASTFTWRRIARQLAATHRVIALDLKGFGQSDKPFDLAYSVADHAALVAAFLEKRDLTNVTLVGHSLGGTITLALALDPRAAARIRRLVIVAGPAYDSSISEFVSLTLTPVGPDLILATMPAEKLARIMLAAARRDGTPSEADIAGYAKPLYDLGTRHAILTTGRRLLLDGLDTMSRHYKRIPQPTLIVWCYSDGVVPLATGRRLARDLPHARLRILRGCGHLPQDETPGALLAVLRGFLR